jgi:ribosomal protein L22
MSADKPGQPPEGGPEDAAKVTEEAAEAKQEKAKVEETERAEAAKGEPKAKAAKAKAAKAKAKEKADDAEAKPKTRRRSKAAEKAEPEADAKGAEAKEKADDKATEKAARAKAAKEPAPKAAASRRKAGGHQTTRRRVVRARARYVRTSARKARMVCGHLRGKSVAEARAILAFTPREVARDWSKLLESAVANAESNHELLQDDLIVREAYADEGPTIKRFRPRAMGRATPIRKRTSHLTITLTAAPENGAGGRRG